ncbi:TonB-dependent receptor [uncultured Sphingomonas sp.]|uniref:TonB-dependent receptor n=1 Tax=uncultured Sphingomonas sp. TaxID=158754 RepID=UPI0025DBCC9B|nr:TonB-dependent receptor [uncultured Sphingomonas sp.]
MRAPTPSLAALLLATAAHPAMAQTAPVTPVPGQVPATAPAAAQHTPTPTPTPLAAPVVVEDDIEPATEVTVVGQRERGSVPGDIQPEQVLRPADVRAYGVSSLNDLLTELAPQLGSGRGSEGGMPVVLLNGRRISGFREIGNYPPEAIERVDILPPEAAQQLGYRAEQRVINFVLRRRFNAVTAEVQGGGATQGDRYTTRDEASLLRIMREKRVNVALNYTGQTPVYEADRDIIPTTTPARPFSIAGNLTPGSGLTQIDPALSALAGRTVTVAGNPADAAGRPALSSFLGPVNPSSFGAYRTVSSASQKLESTISYARPIGDTINASLSAGFDWSRNQGALGLATTSLTVPVGNPFSPFGSPVVLNRYLAEGGAREQTREMTESELNGALNGDIGRWRWSVNASNRRTFASTITDNSFDLSPITSRIAANDASLNPFTTFAPALLGDYRQDYARSLRNLATVEMQMNGPTIALPAGDARLNLTTGFTRDDLDSLSIRSGVTTAGNLGRSTGRGQVRIDLPIANRGRGVLGAIGNLAVNASYEFNQLSDFGWLSTYTYGVNWSPLPGKLFLLATITQDENAPTTNQLGDPVIVNPNARVFDFVRGTSVDATTISGGNPNLRASDKRTTNLTLNLRPFSSIDLNLSADYTRTRTMNDSQSLGTPTAALEAAFPDRFVRDGSGQLIRVDTRPVNIAESDQEQLRWGFNFSRRIGPAAPQGGFRGRFGGGPAGAVAGAGQQGRSQRGQSNATVGANGPTQASPAGDAAQNPTQVVVTATQDNPPPPPPPPAGGPGGPGEGRRFGGPGGPGGPGRGFGGGGFGGGNEGRVQLTVFHTWRFRNTFQIAPNLPMLDRLNGDATGFGNGVFKHAVTVRSGITKNGYGLRLDADWQSGAYLRGGSSQVPVDLNAAPLTKVNLRTFVNFNPDKKIVRDHPWLIGSRLELAVTNLFDTRQRITDASGNVPLAYQPDQLDPIGRVVSLSFRKLFFNRRPQGRPGGTLGGAAGTLRR